jgi:hypothetical protein
VTRCFGLVPVAATAATAATPAATTAAVATSAAAAATTVAASTATAATAFLARAGFIDGQRAPIILLAVQRGDGRLSFVVRTHFDKPEAFAPTRVPITDHFRAGHGSVLRKKFLQLRAIH